MSPIEQLLRDQDGVIARWQAKQFMSDVEIARWLRRDLHAIFPGVYLNHSGSPTWTQRAWAAVLHAWPAALTHESALRAAEGAGRRGRDERVIHVAIDQRRRIVAAPNVVIHRRTRLEERVQWNLGPPRVRYAEAVLDVADAAASDLGAIARLADACGSRRTTAARLLSALDERSRVRRRAWLTAVLADVAQGTNSVLEHGYLNNVVRPHGLPCGSRQTRHEGGGGVIYTDVELPELGLIVELDGGLFHAAPEERDRDLDRDLAAAAERAATTLRLGFGQVYGRSCATAHRLAVVFARQGWSGERHLCPECPGWLDATG